jgi:hypothetical protein
MYIMLLWDKLSALPAQKSDLSHQHFGFSKWFVPFPLGTIQFQFLPKQQIGTHKN